MKKFFKLFGVIAFVAIIGFSFAALSLTGCSGGDSGGIIIIPPDDGTGGGGTSGGTGGTGGTGGGSGGGTTPTTNYSLDGVWETSYGQRITVSGSTGIISALPSDMGALWNDARYKGYVNVGNQYWRNLTSTGNLTWSGQMLQVTWGNSNPNVATGTTWSNDTFTMSADGQILTVNGTDSSGVINIIFTRGSSYSLDGVWVSGDGDLKVTVSGNTGVISALPSDMGALWNDARNKGYVNVGSQYWRNLTSTGNLTWSGQMLTVTWVGSSNSATGTDWSNDTFTMSADGQTLTVNGTDSSGVINFIFKR